MSTASSIAAAVAIIGALIAAVLLPARARAEAPPPAAELLDPAPGQSPHPPIGEKTEPDVSAPRR